MLFVFVLFEVTQFKKATCFWYVYPTLRRRGIIPFVTDRNLYQTLIAMFTKWSIWLIDWVVFGKRYQLRFDLFFDSSFRMRKTKKSVIRPYPSRTFSILFWGQHESSRFFSAAECTSSSVRTPCLTRERKPFSVDLVSQIAGSLARTFGNANSLTHGRCYIEKEVFLRLNRIPTEGCCCFEHKTGNSCLITGIFCLFALVFCGFEAVK